MGKQISTAEFTAAQAAQKHAPLARTYCLLFTAAQAAQKHVQREAEPRAGFTAAQAAQKSFGP